MRAVVMRAFGGEDVLELDDVPDPSPGAGEALVRVGAVEVSRTRDVATRTGRHPFSQQVSLPHVLGGDFAGVVETVGPGAEPALVGRRVAVSNSAGCGSCPACRDGREAQCPELSLLGIHRWGSYAELVTVPAANLTPVPDDVSLPQAAAMAATGPIALTQLHAARVEAGDWMLVTGATGALGTMLGALAAWRGAKVIALSRRPSAIPEPLALAARLCSSEEDLADSILRVTSGLGVAAAIDNVADGDTFTRYLPAVAIGGRIVVSGAIGGAAEPMLPVPARTFYVRSLSLLGVRTTSRPDTAWFWELVHSGLRLPEGLIRMLPLEAAAEAHASISQGAAIGHTVLSVAA
jgi:NADPH:quinone reductase-like Zn-dependent oxidoreductase